MFLICKKYYQQSIRNIINLVSISSTMSIVHKKHPQLGTYMYHDTINDRWSNSYFIQQTSYSPNRNYYFQQKTIFSERKNQVNQTPGYAQKKTDPVRNSPHQVQSLVDNTYINQQQSPMRKINHQTTNIHTVNSYPNTNVSTFSSNTSKRQEQQKKIVTDGLSEQRIPQQQRLHNNQSNHYNQNGALFDSPLQDTVRKQALSSNSPSYQFKIFNQPQNTPQSFLPIQKNSQKQGNGLHFSSSKNILTNDSLNNELTVLKTKLSNLQMQNVQKETKITILQIDLKILKDSLSTKDAQINHYNNIQENYSIEKNKLESDLREYKNKWEISQYNLKKLQFQYDHHQRKSNYFQLQNRPVTLSPQKQAEIKRLEADNNRLRNQNTAIIQQCKTLQEEIKRLNSALNEAEDKLNRAKYDTTIAQDKSRIATQLNQNLIKSNNKIQKLETELLTQRENTKGKAAELAKVKKQNQSIYSQKLRLQDSIKYKQNFSNIIISENQKLKNQIQQLKKQIQVKKIIEEQNSTLKNQIVQLRQKIEKANKNIESVQANNQREREKFQTKMYTLQNQNQQLKTELQKIKQMNNNLTVQLASFSQQPTNNNLSSTQKQFLKTQTDGREFQPKMLQFKSKSNFKYQKQRPLWETQQIKSEIVIVNKLTQQNEELKREIETLRLKKEEQLRYLSCQIQTISEQKIKQTQSIRLTIINNQQKIREIEDQLIKAIQHIRKQQFQRNIFLQDIHNMRYDLKRMAGDLDRKELELGILLSEKQTYQKIVQSQAQLKQQNLKLQQQLQALNQKIRLNQQNKNELLLQRSTQRDQILNQLKIQLSNKQQTIRNLEATNKNNVDKLQESQRGYKQKVQQVTILQQKYRQYQRQTKDQAYNLTSQINLKEGQLRSLNEQLKKREYQIENLKRDSQRTQSMAINYSNNYEHLQKQLSQLKLSNNQKDMYIRQIQFQMRNYQQSFTQLRKDLMFVEEKKRKLEDQKLQLQQQNKELLNEKARLNQRISLSNEQLNQLKQEKIYLENRVKELQQKTQNDKWHYDNMINQKTQLQQAHNNLLQVHSFLKIRCQELEKTNSKQHIKLKTDYNNIQKLHQQQSRLYEQVCKKYGQLLTRQESRLSFNRSTQKQQLVKVNAMNQDLRSRLENLQRQFDKKKVSQQQIKREYKIIENQILIQKQKNLSSTQQINRLSQQIRFLQNQLDQIKYTLHQMQLKYSDLQADLRKSEQKNREIGTLKAQKSEIQIELSRSKLIYNEFVQQNRKLREQAQQIERANKNLKNNQGCNHRHLFHGDILRQQDEYKLFIKQSIQNLLKRRILDARLIYRFEPLNRENIHKYIDQKPHLVVVIRVSNGFCLAGYAEGIFKPRTSSDKQGLIMSLTNKKCYNLVETNKRAINYDDFFVIFGNSEIRLKSLQKKIFSNFGLSNSYYRHNGDGVSILLGGGKNEREMQIIGYQFFQLIFEQ